MRTLEKSLSKAEESTADAALEVPQGLTSYVTDPCLKRKALQKTTLVQQSRKAWRAINAEKK